MWAGGWRVLSAVGAAASFGTLLLWLHYTSLIFLLGAEFTAWLGDPLNQNAHKPPAQSSASQNVSIAIGSVAFALGCITPSTQRSFYP